MKLIRFAVILSLVFTTYAVQAVEQTAFSGAGIIESTNGGFKFPDGSVQLSATTPPCTTITYVPYVITTSGVYCLTGNLETSMTSGTAIEIQADNATINLNGWTLDGTGAGLTTNARGIYSFERKNINIRNGAIHGFWRAMQLDANDGLSDFSQGHIVEDIHVEKNTGISMQILGSSNIVRNNQIIQTGGSAGEDYVLHVIGSGCRVLNNDITKASGEGELYGIFLVGDGAVVEGNRIDELVTGGTSYGIYVGSSNEVLIRANSITRADEGIHFSSSTGKYMDNLTSGVTLPFTGGTPIGVND